MSQTPPNKPHKRFVPKMLRRKNIARQETSLQQAINRLTLLGKIRDGILVSGAIFYAAGYLVWSIHAWINNMGMLPALDFQYFVAGSVPVLIVFIAYVIGRSLWHFIMKVMPQKVHAKATGGWRVLRYVLISLFGAALFGFVFLASPVLALIVGIFWLMSILPQRWKIKPYDSLPPRAKIRRAMIFLAIMAFFIYVLVKRDVINATFFGFVEHIEDQMAPILGLAMLVSVLFLPMPEKDWITRWLKVFYFVLTILLFPFIGLTYYTLEIYPNWPQELGGVQPRCAYVDVSPEDLSAETRTALLPERPDESNSDIMRSHRLAVLFSNDSYMLVKPWDKTSQQSDTVYELRKSDLKAISWCD